MADNPVGKPVKLGLGELHSARRGDYRVIYRIDDQQRRVTGLAIEHRFGHLPAAAILSAARASLQDGIRQRRRLRTEMLERWATGLAAPP